MNKGCFKKGCHASPETEFKKGHKISPEHIQKLKELAQQRRNGQYILCHICKKQIYRKPSRIKEYNFCSQKCFGAFLKIKMKGKNPWNTGKHLSESHRKKISESTKGKPSPLKGRSFPKGNPKRKHFGNKNANWKGGRVITGHKIHIYKPNHLSSDKRNYILESRYIMEQFLGRCLTKNEIVHHVNRNPNDNRIENLMLFPNRRTHRLYHAYNAFDKLYK